MDVSKVVFGKVRVRLVKYGKSYRIYQSVGYGYGSRTELTKGSGTGMDVVSSLPKCRVRVWTLVPVHLPDPLYVNKPMTGTRVFCRGRTELTKVSSTDIDVVPSLPKCRVRIGMLHQAYQRVGHRYGCLTKLCKGSGMVRLLVPVPVPVPDPVYFNKVLTGTRVFYRGRTEFTKVSGTGGEVFPSLPKCRVRVIQRVRTPGTHWYVHYLTHL